MKCVIAGCGEECNAVLFGLSLCEWHIEIAEGCPVADDEWATMTTGRLYRWIWSIEAVVGENPRAITAEEQAIRIRALVGTKLGAGHLAALLVEEAARLREKEMGEKRTAG